MSLHLRKKIISDLPKNRFQFYGQSQFIDLLIQKKTANYLKI
jgi:hypothetical protein